MKGIFGQKLPEETPTQLQCYSLISKQESRGRTKGLKVVAEWWLTTPSRYYKPVGLQVWSQVGERFFEQFYRRIGYVFVGAQDQPPNVVQANELRVLH